MDEITPFDPFKELACFDPSFDAETFSRFMLRPTLPVALQIGMDSTHSDAVVDAPFQKAKVARDAV